MIDRHFIILTAHTNTLHSHNQQMTDDLFPLCDSKQITHVNINVLK